MIGNKYWLGVLVALIAAAVACGPVGDGPKGGDSRDGRAGDDSASGGSYAGAALAQASPYDATLEVVFEPQTGAGWVYRLEVLADGGEQSRLRRLTIEGVSGPEYPGDVALLEFGVRQYMTGPGVSESFEGVPCIIAPRELEVDESFLMPDDFLPPAELGAALTETGTTEVNGIAAASYSLQNTHVGEISVSQGEVVIAEEGGYVLSMEISGTLTDTYFTDTTGPVQLTYQVDDLRTEAELAVPDDCAIPYPVLADAVELTWFGDLLGYKTLVTPDEAVTFYQQELADAGWGVLEIPREVEGATRLTYAREGVILTIGIGQEDDFTAVSLVVER